MKQKHLLLFVAEALTGGSSLETQRKMRQLRALRGKLRDGIIRGERARRAAMLEIEKLERETNISRNKETSLKVEDKGSLRNDRALHDSKDEYVRSVKESLRSPADDRGEGGGAIGGTEGSSVDDGDRALLSDASAEPRQGKVVLIDSLRNFANQSIILLHISATELPNDDNKLLSNIETLKSSHSEGMKREPSSDGTATPGGSLREDETRTSGKLNPHTHTQFFAT